MARSAAALIAAFAIAFILTALARRSTPSPQPADTSARAAQLRTREESLSREIAALREESRRSATVEPLTPAPAPEAWTAAIRREYEIRVRGMVVKKTRRARLELGLTEDQLATYALRLREAAQRDPMLALGDWDKSDPEALAPLLDSDQHRKYLDKLRKGGVEETQSETQFLARILSTNPTTAGQVNQMLREEGVIKRDTLLTFFDRPREARALVDKAVGAMDRVRVRVRPLLSPEEYERLERHLADEAGTLEIFVDEIQRADAALKD